MAVSSQKLEPGIVFLIDLLGFVIVFNLEAEPPTHLPADFGTSALIVSELHKPGNGGINAYETHGKFFSFRGSRYACGARRPS